MNALQIILFLIGLQLVVIAFLLVAALVTQSRKSGAKVQSLKLLWGGLLPAALAGQPGATAVMRGTLGSKTAFEAFHGFFDEQLRRERGRSPLALRRLSRAIGFTERLERNLLRSRDPFNRAAAAKTLGRLRESTAQETAIDLLGSKDPAVVLAAAYATASYRDPKQLLAVFRAVYDRTPITLHGAAELLSGFGDGACPVVHELLVGVASRYPYPRRLDPVDPVAPGKDIDPDDTAAQTVMIDLMAFYGYVPAEFTLLRLLRVAEDHEVLIHLVKAIAKVGNVAAVPRLTELLTHPNWVIRSQSAQALAALGAIEAAPSVRALLDDNNLAVRACAQRTLRALEAAEIGGKENLAEALA
jgi:hypothetical protein